MSSCTGSAMPHVATPQEEPCRSWLLMQHPREALGLAMLYRGLVFLMVLLLLLKGSLP